jgi:hypothetical protein
MTRKEIERLKSRLSALAGRRNYWAQRFACEMEFAEALAELQPDRARGWKRLMERAREAVRDALSAGKLDSLERAGKMRVKEKEADEPSNRWDCDDCRGASLRPEAPAGGPPDIIGRAHRAL